MAAVCSCPAQPWDPAWSGLDSEGGRRAAVPGLGAQGAAEHPACFPLQATPSLGGPEFFNRCQRHVGQAGSAKFVLPVLCLFSG